MMEANRVLVLLHAADSAALEALAAVKAPEIVIGLVGESAANLARPIGGFPAARWLAVEGPEFARPRYASDAAAAEAICRTAAADLVIAPHGSRWARALPGVAQRLGAAIDTHITALGAGVSRWFYRQRIEAVFARQQRPWFLLVEPGVADPWQPVSGDPTIEILPVEAASRTQVTGVEAPAGNSATIRPDARLLFVAGAGWTKKQLDGQIHGAEAEKLILDFVERAQCSLGSSKSLVDLAGEGQAVLSFLTHLHQVGQTGSTPRHPKGLATCCHGEEPHVVGWRFIAERRAVNLDPNCGWARGKADVLYVADAFEVMRAVAAALAK